MREKVQCSIQDHGLKNLQANYLKRQEHKLADYLGHISPKDSQEILSKFVEISHMPKCPNGGQAVAVLLRKYVMDDFANF